MPRRIRKMCLSYYYKLLINNEIYLFFLFQIRITFTVFYVAYALVADFDKIKILDGSVKCAF